MKQNNKVDSFNDPLSATEIPMHVIISVSDNKQPT
jgi:hypothetical protein